MGRAHHHLGLVHPAAENYECVLRISAERAEARARLPPPALPPHSRKDATTERAAAIPDQDMAREAAHNLARICLESGSKALARKIMSALPVV